MDGQKQREEIERCLKENKQTKRGLSDYLDILPQNLNRVLENEFISVYDLRRIALFLNRSLSDFLPNDFPVLPSVVPQIMSVPLVQQYAYTGYLYGFSPANYVGELPTIPFVEEKEYKGRYLYFEISGDSMDDGSKRSDEAGDIVLVREISIQYWNSKLYLHRW